MFAPIAGRPRFTAYMWFLLLALGCGLGLLLALPVGTDGCPAPGANGHPGCVQLVWGHAFVVVGLVSVGTAAVGHLLGHAIVRVAAAARELARPRPAPRRSPVRPARRAPVAN